MHHDGSEIYLSQLISGILLFKKDFTYNEINKIMSLFYCKLNCDVLDSDSDYDSIYDFIEQNDNGYKLSYGYDSIIKMNGKKITFYNYLKANTTLDIIEFLMNNVYYEQEYQKTNIYVERVTLNPMIGKMGKIKQNKHGVI